MLSGEIAISKDHENLFLRSLHCYMLKFSLLAQIFRWPVAIQNGDLLAPRRQVTGQGPSSPSKCEGSEKDFSLRSK
jgi:hypothetical protein